jgi:hypothetical protein
MTRDVDLEHKQKRMRSQARLSRAATIKQCMVQEASSLLWDNLEADERQRGE